MALNVRKEVKSSIISILDKSSGGISDPSLSQWIVIGGSPDNTAHITTDLMPSSRSDGNENDFILGPTVKKM